MWEMGLMRGRQEKKKHGGGAAALWILLMVLVLILLKGSFLPSAAPYLIIGSAPSGASRQGTTIDVDATEDMVAAPLSKLTCNLSNHYSDTCTMTGDMRIHGKSATVHVLSVFPYHPENSTIKIKPYARKWEQPVMQYVREVTVQSTSPPAGDDSALPKCSVKHDVPAIVFSTGGYNRNFFHVVTDVIIPLYLTAREYNGSVQLLATDYEPKWIAKYSAILGALSIYRVIDLDSDDAVRCFSSGHVGLESHKELGIDPGLSRNGYTMMTFRDFLRSTYWLPRPWATPISRSSGQKPRLVMILRRHSRALANEAEAMDALRGLGFEVVSAGPEVVSDMDRFAGVVNSCDVMVGVHGAGLTNMVFLPHNATVVQIIPWGGMKWPCRHAFGDPVADMGMRYVEYEATAEETTLKETYAKDHAVFTDPESVHRQGFDKVWAIFLNGQNITLDIPRFRGAMQELYQSITTE